MYQESISSCFMSPPSKIILVRLSIFFFFGGIGAEKNNYIFGQRGKTLGENLLLMYRLHLGSTWVLSDVGVTPKVPSPIASRG